MSVYLGPTPERPAGSGAPAPGRSLEARVGRDLVPRVLSALVIGTITIATIWAGPGALSGFLIAVLAVVAWEWGHIVRGRRFDAATLAHVVAIGAAIFLTWPNRATLALIVLAGGAVLTGLLAANRQPWFSALGVPVAGLPGVALMWMRADLPLGATAIFFIICTVAATDIAAFFCGRLIGGTKLWPSVSPNKTWAGLLGGVAAAGTVGAASGSIVAGADTLHLLALGALLGVVAQAGDLAESALKRHFGTKDASDLIPGHGGFMDRVDGIAAATVFAAIWALFVDPAAPARALLAW